MFSDREKVGNTIRNTKNRAKGIFNLDNPIIKIGKKNSP